MAAVVPVKGMGRTKATFDEHGRLVNTHCDHCGLDHLTVAGIPSCRAHRRAAPDQPCRGNPEAGRATCYWHGGASDQAKAGGRKRLALGAIHEVVIEQRKLGGVIDDLDEVTAMLSMLREAAYNVAVYRVLVQELEARVDSGTLDLLGGSLLAGSPLAMRVKLDDLTAQPHIIKKFYDDERDRLMRYAKICKDADLGERQVKVAEEAGAWLVQMLDVIFEQLHLTDEQQIRLPGVMTHVLEVFETNQTGELKD